MIILFLKKNYFIFFQNNRVSSETDVQTDFSMMMVDNQDYKIYRDSEYLI